MPLKEEPTWQIKDSSKLDAFQRCNRYYFFRYILGWSPDTPSHDLYFGEAWHRAREVQLLLGYDAVAEAYEAFEAHYRQFIAPEDDNIYLPKVPAAVLNGLMRLQAEHQLDLVENEVVEIDGELMTEIAGTVPVDENRVLHYRLDDIMRHKETGKVFSWDHKTTSEKYINGRQWADQFSLSLQNGTYTHCLYCLFPIEEVLGMEFYGVGFVYLKRGSPQRGQGHHCTFRKVPAYKTPDQMNSWLWTANSLLDSIDREMDRFSNCREDDQVLMSFPMNGTSCTDYRGCEFNDFCLAWQNPLQNAYEPPLGFKIEHWDPSAREASVKKDLTMGGGQ